MIEERELIKQEYQALRIDKQALREDQQVVREERKMLREERHVIKLEGEALRAEKQALTTSSKAAPPAGGTSVVQATSNRARPPVARPVARPQQPQNIVVSPMKYLQKLASSAHRTLLLKTAPASCSASRSGRCLSLCDSSSCAKRKCWQTHAKISS